MKQEDQDKLLYDIHAKVCVTAEQMNDIRQTIYGNGQPGLCSRFAVVEQSQKDCIAANGKTPVRRANLIACAALVLMAITLALNISGVI